MQPDEVLHLLESWELGMITGCTVLAHPGVASDTWNVHTVSGGRYVAKLIFDRRQFVEPGLRVAAALDAAGVTTGCPVKTIDGQLALEVDDGSRRATLAVLRHFPGAPLDLATHDAPAVAGDLLGRVHAALQRLTSRSWVPGDLLAWCGRDSENERAQGALSRLADFERQRLLTRGVVYGDPAPEILVDRESRTVALIDWGTPSWGPLMHDVACWLRYLETGGRGGQVDRTTFLDAYLNMMALDRAELDALDAFALLHRALGMKSRW